MEYYQKNNSLIILQILEVILELFYIRIIINKLFNVLIGNILAM